MPVVEPVVTEIMDEDEIGASSVAKAGEEVVAVTGTLSNEVTTTTTSLEPEPSTSSTADKVSAIDEEEHLTYEAIGNESDIQILVPQISVLDLDEIEDKPYEPVSTTMDDISQAPIKIKEEPKDDGYEDEDDGFEEVGIFEEPALIDDDSGKFFFVLLFFDCFILIYLQFSSIQVKSTSINNNHHRHPHHNPFNNQ